MQCGITPPTTGQGQAIIHQMRRQLFSDDGSMPSPGEVDERDDRP